MNAGKAIALGCVGVGLLGFVGLVAVFGFLYHVSQDPEGIAISVDAPLDVAVGDTFSLVVTVTNEREGENVTLSDIDIADEYLAGFVVLTVDPAEESSMHIPLDNSMSYTFNTEVPAGGSKAFTFNLRAQEAGVFRGQIDATEGMRFTSTVAQTVVNEAAERPTQ
jgi:hypothetical protein